LFNKKEKGVVFMAPNTFEDWIDVSKERQSDAIALLNSRKESTGPVYMVGYAIETYLKAVIAKNKKVVPKIHEIRELWIKAGFKLNDIKDKSGKKTFFFENWTTDLRYETSLSQAHDSNSLVKAAGNILTWIEMRSQKVERIKRKR
jgi:HEPN domain-containing protein